MYSFAQRPDTKVFDEPFYAVYLTRSGADHPGKEAVLRDQSSDEQVVINEIFGPTPESVVFIKNMAHHIEVLEKRLPRDVINLFLIRDPRQIIASYSEVIEKPVMRDIGIRYQYELFAELKAKGESPVVIDSGKVVANPGAVLAALCQSVGIEYTPAMLSWPPGPKPYDGVWASHWYANVHRSTGFEKQSATTRDLPASLLPLYEEARGYYEKLLSFALNL